MKDWVAWHNGYDQPGSSLARRLAVVQRYIAAALDRCLPGPIRVISLCAGDGRDLFGVLASHPRATDVSGRLVELDTRLAERAREAAPAGIEVVCGDAALSDSYVGVTPAHLVLACGIFGNLSEADIRRTIEFWPRLCARGGSVIWTRGAFDQDLRDTIRGWVVAAGFAEVAYQGPPEEYGVGLARMTRAPLPLTAGERCFTFVSRSS